MSYPDQPDFSRPILGPIINTSKLESRSTRQNDGTPIGYFYSAGNNFRGKYFPRGCRGHISNIQLYCRDVGAAGGTIRIHISPIIGFGETFAGNVVVPAGGGPAWRNAVFNVPWNYDSLFVWFVAWNVNLEGAYDVTFPQDAHQSADAGITWAPEVRRYYIRVVYNAETCGDVPVSGTLNVIEIPSISSAQRHVTSPFIPVVTTWYDAARYGAGNILYILWRLATEQSYLRMYPYIRCDGNMTFPIIGTFDQIWLGFINQDDSALGWTIHDAVNHRYALCCKIKYPFKRTLEVGFHNGDPVNPNQGEICYSYKVIS